MNLDDLFKQAETIARQRDLELEQEAHQDEICEVSDTRLTPVHEFLMKQLCPCWAEAAVVEYDMAGPDMHLWLAVNTYDHRNGTGSIKFVLVIQCDDSPMVILKEKYV